LYYGGATHCCAGLYCCFPWNFCALYCGCSVNCCILLYYGYCTLLCYGCFTGCPISCLSYTLYVFSILSFIIYKVLQSLPRVQLTYKSNKMYSSILSDISVSGESDRDHAHVFLKSHTMVLLKLKSLAYPLQYISHIMDTHSCDGLLSYKLYTRHLLFSPFLCFNSTKMLISSDFSSTLPQLDLYACTSFLLTTMLFSEPRPGSGIFVVS